MTWQSLVPLVKDGQPVSAPFTNPPAVALQKQTAYLKSRIDAVTAGTYNILQNAGLAPDVVAGDVVYFDATNTRYAKALGAWEDTYAPDGRVTPAATAVVAGVVTRASSGVGDIIVNGVCSLHTYAVNHLLDGETPEIGKVYYLSMLTPGTVTVDIPHAAIRVFQLLGQSPDGYFLRVFDPAWLPITHTHREYLLEYGGWADVVGFPDAPVGATYGFNMAWPSAVTQNLAETLLAEVGGAHFHLATDATHDPGSLLDTGYITLDANGIWWFAADPPDSNIIMNVTHVDASGVSLLHSLLSTAKFLVATTTNGRVTLAGANLEEASSEDSGVVKAIDFASGVVTKGDVVTAIQWGRGIQGASSVPGGKGIVTMQLSGFDDELLTASILNLDNAVTDVEGALVLVVLPAGRASVVNCERTFPNFGSVRYKMVFRFMAYGPAAGQAMPSISYQLMPTASALGVDIEAPVTVAMPAAPLDAEATKAYLIESEEIDLEFNSRGAVFFSLSATPVQNIRLFDIGVTLKIYP